MQCICSAYVYGLQERIATWRTCLKLRQCAWRCMFWQWDIAGDAYGSITLMLRLSYVLDICKCSPVYAFGVSAFLSLHRCDATKLLHTPCMNSVASWFCRAENPEGATHSSARPRATARSQSSDARGPPAPAPGAAIARPHPHGAGRGERRAAAAGGGPQRSPTAIVAHRWATLRQLILTSPLCRAVLRCAAALVRDSVRYSRCLPTPALPHRPPAAVTAAHPRPSRSSLPLARTVSHALRPQARRSRIPQVNAHPSCSRTAAADRAAVQLSASEARGPLGPGEVKAALAARYEYEYSYLYCAQ